MAFTGRETGTKEMWNFSRLMDFVFFFFSLSDFVCRLLLLFYDED